MSSVKVWIIVVVLWLLFLLGAILLSGCSFLPRPSNDTPVFTDTPPTPGVQLWNAAKKSNWLVTLSILGMAGGVFALANGSVKMGFATIAATSASLFMALAVARFALWLAVCGAIGSIAVVFFSILARRRALVEIIRGVQKSKVVVHGRDKINSAMGDKQTITTKKIVGKIKNELRLKGKI